MSSSTIEPRPFPPDELARVLGREPGSWTLEPLAHGTPAATAGLWRVDADGESLVLKLLHADRDGNPRWPAGAAPDHPYYWRREAEAYASGLLDRLSPPLRAPACRACLERPDGAVALWLEHVELPPAAGWPLERYRLAARHLGRAQAQLAVEPPTEPWLSRRWLRAYLELRPEVGEHGRGPTRRLWDEREALLERIEAAPQTLCHLDCYPANLFGDDAETVLLDWAYCGLGALGEDASNLGPDALLDAFVPAARGHELVRLVWDGYRAGLREAGWAGDEGELRFVFTATAGLKYAWIPAWLALGRAGDRHGEWRAAVPLIEELAEEARQLASSP